MNQSGVLFFCLQCESSTKHRYNQQIDRLEDFIVPSSNNGQPTAILSPLLWTGLYQFKISASTQKVPLYSFNSCIS